MAAHLFSRSAALLLGTTVLLHATLLAADRSAHPSREPVLEYANRQFHPSRVEVPAGESLVLRVVNHSHERIEFESFTLNREKVVAPGATITVRLPALKPGSYDFFDDFHDAVPEGEIVAVAARH